MNVFKRICLFIFSLAGLLALAALCLPWVGPWTREATALIGNETYFVALEGCVSILGVGLIITFLRSIFQRNRKVVEVSRADGDLITVTRDAIASQAAHVVESDGTLRARRVRVRAKKRGHVRVFVRVQPQVPVDVVECGSELHEQLMEGLAKVCGNTIDKVTLEFTGAGEESAQQTDASESEVTVRPEHDGTTPVSIEAASVTATSDDVDESFEAGDASENAPAQAPESSEITVSMGRMTHPATSGSDDGGDEE